jgi:hypothetical protein
VINIALRAEILSEVWVKPGEAVSANGKTEPWTPLLLLLCVLCKVASSRQRLAFQSDVHCPLPPCWQPADFI